MRIMNPQATIEHMPSPHDIMQVIEAAGRTCYKSEDKMSDDSSSSFIRKIIASGHESVIEHGQATVRFIIDRGISHELVRHRLAAYSQESTRYANYSKDRFGGHVTFIKPVFFPDVQTGEYDSLNDFIAHNSKENVGEEIFGRATLWGKALLEAEGMYFDMLEEGATPQEARSVLPHSLKTEVVMTANFREWRHVFKLRTAKAAHPQIREVMVPLLRDFQNKLPALFEDV